MFHNIGRMFHNMRKQQAILARVGVVALAATLVFLVSLPIRAQSPPTPSGGSAYVLGPGDVLEVSVWGYADLTRVVAVRPDGKISLPIVGDVRASGLAVDRLTRVLTQAFAQYIKNPQVSVIVKEFRRISVSILGQVARPGTYLLRPDARLLDLLSAAGGLTEVAASQAQLLAPERQPLVINLDRVLAGDKEANLALRGGETLVVPEDLVNIVNVTGQVARPGRYRLKGEMRVLDALLLAGGLTEKASLTDSRLVRGATETRSLNLDALLLRQDMTHNITLQPGDSLFISEELNNKIYVLGDVTNPGAFPVKDEPTLLQALAMAGGPVQRGPATAKTIHIVRRGGNTDTQQIVASAGKVEPLPNGGLLVTVELQSLMQPTGLARNLTVRPGDVIVVPQTSLSGLQFVINILSGIFWIFR